MIEWILGIIGVKTKYLVSYRGPKNIGHIIITATPFITSRNLNEVRKCIEEEIGEEAIILSINRIIG